MSETASGDRQKVWAIGPYEGAPITERSIDPDEAAVDAQNEAGERFGHDRVSADRQDWVHRVWIRFDSREEAVAAKNEADRLHSKFGRRGLQIIGWVEST